jgi:hypothetical protein
MNRFRSAQILLSLASATASLTAQTLYAPAGSGGVLVQPSSNASVGIGTSTPLTSLQVVGPITAGDGGGSTQGIDYLYGYYNGSGKLFTIGSLYSSAASFLGYSVKAHPAAAGYVSSNGFNIGRSAFEANDGFLAFLTGASQTSTDGGSVTVTERMRIDAAGNVGIGTTNPTYKLSIDSGSGSYLFRAHTVGDFVFALAGDGSGGTNLDLFSIRNNNTGIVHLNTINGARMALGVSTGSTAGAIVENMSIIANGNVGIGTTNPTQKLSVNGTIRAKEVIVDTGWSDYVFRPDYRLAPLSEIEGAIQKDGHLPGIPSAQEVAEHGVSVGEMQSKLLAKIEELTLHVIAQEKELAALKRELHAPRKLN